MLSQLRFTHGRARDSQEPSGLDDMEMDDAEVMIADLQPENCMYVEGRDERNEKKAR